MTLRFLKPNSTHCNVILIRHGDSTFTVQKKFCGWDNPPLAQSGIDSANKTGVCLQKTPFTKVYTSNLTRAAQTAKIIMKHQQVNPKLPIVQTSLLNERMYGALQGQDKMTMKLKYGDELEQMRRSLFHNPPPLETADPDDPKSTVAPANTQTSVDADEMFDPSRTTDIEVPISENLYQVIQRVKIFLTNFLLPDITNGETCLVIGHSNSVRALFYLLNDIYDETINPVHIPNSIPIGFEIKRIIQKPIALKTHEYSKILGFSVQNWGFLTDDIPHVLKQVNKQALETFIPPKANQRPSGAYPISCVFNNISTMEPFLKNISVLTQLDLSFNSIKSIPDEITCAKYLKVLILSHNEITSVSPKITKLEWLEFVDLSFNRLSVLPVFGKSTRYDITYNPISKIRFESK